MSIYKYTIKNSTINVIKVNNLIFETINFFSLDLIKLIEEYLIYDNEYRKNRKYTCDLDFLNPFRNGFYHSRNNYFEAERVEEVKLDPKIKNHLFWHLHKSGYEEVATDCSKSNELSVNECSDVDNFSIRYRYRFSYDMDSSDDRQLKKTFKINKDKFIYNLLTKDQNIIEEQFFEHNGRKTINTFWIDNEQLRLDLNIKNIEYCDSSDEADDEC